jgi:O-antigen/teichoic acid export membrane protein
LLLLLCFSFFGRLTPLTASISYTANGIPIALWLFAELRKTIVPRLSNVLNNAKTLLGYGLPAYGIDLCGTLSLYVDQAMVLNFLEPKAMGIYAVAVSVSRMLNFCQTSVTMVLLPKAAGLEAERAVSLTARAARTSMFVTTVGFLFLATPLAIHILYGTDFEAAVAPLRLLLIEAVIGGTVMVLSQAALALGRPGLITGLQVCGLVTTIPLMYFLVPRYGLIGAATALLISTCLRLGLILLCFPYVLGYCIPRLWLTRNEVADLWSTGRRFVFVSRPEPSLRLP